MIDGLRPMPARSCSPQSAPSPTSLCWPGKQHPDMPASQYCSQSAQSRSDPRHQANSPVMRFRRPMSPTKHPRAMWAISRYPQRGGRTLCRVRRHLWLRFGLFGWSGIERGWGFGCGGSGLGNGDVVDDAELTAFLGRPVVDKRAFWVG